MMKKVSKIVCLIAFIALCNIKVGYTISESDVRVVYNTKVLPLEQSCLSHEDRVYIPLRAFSEQLHYTVSWNNREKCARVQDTLNDLHIYMAGSTTLNGVDGTVSAPLLSVEGTVYVPLRFVSEYLGIDVEWNPRHNTVAMTGRTLYTLSNQNELIAFTKTGKERVTQITAGDNDTVELDLVNRTEYSDVVDVHYTSYGAITRAVNAQLYIKEGHLVYQTPFKSERAMPYTGKALGVRYYDDRVAFLTRHERSNALIKIFNDRTGTLLETINTTALYRDVFNIQAVGEDFLVVNMLLEGESLSDGSFSDKHFMTTVVELGGGSMTPVYENAPSPDSYLIEATRTSQYIITGLLPSDGIVFMEKNGDDLRFACMPSAVETVEVIHKLTHPQ